jgi:hypothetical protein
MRQLDFFKPSAIQLEDEIVTDHNRSSISVAYERIHDTVRTQFGELRKYHRADKRSFSLSWTMLPERSDYTVDGGMGARDMETFFLENTGVILMTLFYDVSDDEEINVIVTNFSMELEKRWNPTSFYSVSLSLEEV